MKQNYLLRSSRIAGYSLALFLIAIQSLALPTQSRAEPRHGIAMHGEPLHGPEFENFNYVNPDAPIGGDITFGSIGSFDSLNPLIVRGVSASGLRDYTFESLMARSFDEPFSLYGLIAEWIDVPDDRSSVTFRIREEARFSDGMPVTVEDVIFSHALLRDHGRPNHRYYYSRVASVERLDDRTVKFVFDPDGDRELALIMGLMPILPKHIFDPETFEQTTLVPPIASGPYLVQSVDPGSRIVYRRNPDYWGWHLPVNRGRYNFETITIDYYRDSSTLFEAFKKGLYHVRSEGDPGRWSQGYDFPAVTDGRVILESYDTGVPSGMSALVFNTRRDIFLDIRVRRALTLLFDFEWINKNLFFGAYSRTQSYFDKSELSSHGQPASDSELSLLEPYMANIPPDIINGSFNLPVSDGTGRNRRTLRAALQLLEEAGWVIRDGKLTNSSTGELFVFELLVVSRDQERLALSFASSLEKAGIDVQVRLVDSSQYQQRRQSYDFDMIQNFWYASLSPGNEQSFYWGGESATTEGTRNYMGVVDPAIDVMIAAMLAARDRPEFVDAVRALDRMLMSGSYVLPLFHLPQQWVARWSFIGRPDAPSLYGYKTDAWWYQGELASESQ